MSITAQSNSRCFSCCQSRQQPNVEYLRPDQNYKKFHRNEKLWKIAAITVAVAFGALVIGSCLVALTLTSLSVAALHIPLYIIGLMFITPLIGSLYKKMMYKSIDFRFRAEYEKGVSEQLDRLKKMRPFELHSLIEQSGVDLDRIPMQNPCQNETFLALFAHYLHAFQTCLESSEKARELMESREGSDIQIDNEIDTWIRGHNLLEQQSLPKKFDASCFLQRIYHPDQTTELPGKFVWETPERRFARMNMGKDIYFYNPQTNFGIRFESAIAMHPENIRQHLFGS